VLKIVSWNVNGLAACRRKGLLQFLPRVDADVVCLQEIKSRCALDTPGYLQFWNPAKRDGYAGTLTLTKALPKSCNTTFGDETLDCEGRMISLEYDDCYVINVYVPNFSTYTALERMTYRLKWENALRDYLGTLQKPVILCGDFNVAYAQVDVYSGNDRIRTSPYIFSDEDRESFRLLLEQGFVDAFREKHPTKADAFTWWSPKNKNREYNRGVRLDYFLVSTELAGKIQFVLHHTDVQGSDHCPITLSISPPALNRSLTDENLGMMWRTIDWSKMEEELQKMQFKIADAANNREWKIVEKLEAELVASFAARVLAVRAVVSAGSEAGVDGVKWKTDAQKMAAALSLTPRGYYPLPYRHQEIEEYKRTRIIHIPAYRDKAMLKLYYYALAPVAEATADKRSFANRIGRSALDLHAYLCSDLSGPDAPGFVLIVDIAAFYESVVHQRLMETIPMDKGILRKFLKAGVIWHGELLSTDKGISLGTSLSPILGNMLLDGLQTYIYNHLYPNGKVDYRDGSASRFADDIIITCRSRKRAEQILGLVEEFLADRGLGVNQEKTRIASTTYGFDFLSRHYRVKSGRVIVEPSKTSVAKIESELESLILGYKGTRRSLIEQVNRKLTGWASYHRIEDSYMAFREVDAAVQTLFIERIRQRYSRWGDEAILRNFFLKDGEYHSFMLPTDPSVYVGRLATIPIVRHKPCKLGFNPYLDRDYYSWLQHRRDVQKATGKYRTIWKRQDGRCAYCEEQMLADQEVDIVERQIGQGRKKGNLMYIHRRCAYDFFGGLEETAYDQLDIKGILIDLLEEKRNGKSPYIPLREHFRTCEQTPYSLSFWMIEQILGHKLDWEAYYYASFWEDDIPGGESLMWKQEGYRFDTFSLTTPDYCISDAWMSQGYVIKALHLHERYIVFQKTAQRVSGLVIPDKLTSQKLPDRAVQLLEEFFEWIIKEFGL